MCWNPGWETWVQALAGCSLSRVELVGIHHTLSSRVTGVLPTFNHLTPKISLLILPFRCYTFPCKLVKRIWC